MVGWVWWAEKVNTSERSKIFGKIFEVASTSSFNTTNGNRDVAHTRAAAQKMPADYDVPVSWFKQSNLRDMYS